MQQRRTLWLILPVLLVPMSLAAQSPTTVSPVDNIRHQIHAFLTTHFQQRYPELVVGDTLKIRTGKLDQRLRLAPCASPLEFSIRELPQNANVTVKTQCVSDHRWSIYVPASIETWRPVWVASRNLARGAVLTESDLSSQTVNTSQLRGGYVSDAQRLLGLELKRPIKAYEAIKLGSLKQPDLVHKGETVVLQVKSSVFTVETEGVALSSGHMGAQVRVRNERSRRVVDGRVVGPGQVQIAIR